MSATNWAICPECLSLANAAAEEDRAAVMALYGTVPVEQFDARRDAIKPVKPEDYRTFREDYKIYGAEDGEVVANYGGSCETCGLEVALRATKQFWPAEPEATS